MQKKLNLNIDQFSSDFDSEELQKNSKPKFQKATLFQLPIPQLSFERNTHR